MEAWKVELLTPRKSYDAVAVAAAHVADVPRLVNDALIHLLAGQRGEIDPMVAIAYAIKNLQEATSAQDRLRIEQEGV